MTIPNTIMQVLSNPNGFDDSEHWTNPEFEGMAHVSKSNHCARQVYYSIRYPQFKPTLPIICGMLVDEYIKSAASQIDDMQTSVKVDFRPEYPIVGEADLVSDNEVCDIKTTSEKGLTYRIRQGPSHDHVAQVNTYAYGLRKRNCSLLYLSRDKFNSYSFEWETDDTKAIASLERLTKIWQTTQLANYIESSASAAMDFEVSHKNGFVLPAKINGEGITLQPGLSWECRYCPYVNKCQKGEA